MPGFNNACPLTVASVDTDDEIERVAFGFYPQTNENQLGSVSLDVKFENDLRSAFTQTNENQPSRGLYPWV